MDLFRSGYRVKGTEVSWNGRPIPRADAATFVPRDGVWARDARSVYVQGLPKKNIDLATWEWLNPVFTKDDRAIHDREGPIKGADPRTFEVLDPGIVVDETIATRVWARGYARDATAVYYHDQMTGRASALRGADPANFLSLRNDYGQDRQRVWHQKSRLPEADPKTWIYLGRLWSMDARRVFYANQEIVGLDRSQFTVVNAPTTLNLATDGHRFFDGGQEIDGQVFWFNLGSDFSTFERRFDVSLRRIVVGEEG